MSDKEIALELVQLTFGHKNPKSTGVPEEMLKETYLYFYKLLQNL